MNTAHHALEGEDIEEALARLEVEQAEPQWRAAYLEHAVDIARVFGRLALAFVDAAIAMQRLRAATGEQAGGKQP